MSERKHNFNAGPTALPLSVLETVQSNLVDFQGQGLSLMEMSHRTPVFEEVIARAKETIARLYQLPDSYEVLFLQGGASMQFAQVPLNLGSGGAYIDTGRWANNAMAESGRIGETHEIWSSRESGYRAVPQQDELPAMPIECPYLHYTSNNTIYGTQFQYVPDVDVPLVCDMSSDFISRPMDVTSFDLIYAGA
jgi:phosphoserine aminotransferase